MSVEQRVQELDKLLNKVTNQHTNGDVSEPKTFAVVNQQHEWVSLMGHYRLRTLNGERLLGQYTDQPVIGVRDRFTGRIDITVYAEDVMKHDAYPELVSSLRSFGQGCEE